MSIHRIVREDGSVVWRVRWREGGRGSLRSDRGASTARPKRRLSRMSCADKAARRARRVLGREETLNHYVPETWAKTQAVTLSRKTAKHYASLYDLHIEPYLGELKLTRSALADPRAAGAQDRAATTEGGQATGAATVEVMRAAANARDPALISVLAYSGLRPQEALALQWVTCASARC